MNFTTTRSNFSYIPSEGSLLTKIGELSKSLIQNTPPSLITLNKKRVAHIIQSSQSLCEEMNIFIDPTEKENINRVTISLKNSVVTEDVIQDSIQLYKSVPEKGYYKFCYHPNSNIFPFAPVEGIISIATSDYQGIIAVNQYEKAEHPVSVPPSDSTEITFFVNTNSVNLKSEVRKMSQPDCDIILDHLDDDIKKSSKSVLECLPDDEVNIQKKESSIEYGCKWNAKNTEIIVNGRKGKIHFDESTDYPFDIHAKISNACGSVFDPGSEYHNKILLSENTYKNVPEGLTQFAVSEADVSRESTTIIPLNSSCKEIEKYMYEELYSDYISKLTDSLSEDTRFVEDIDTFSLEFVNLFFRSLRSSWDYSVRQTSFRKGSPKQLEDKVKNIIGYSTETDFSKFEFLTKKCYIAPIEEPYKKSKSQLSRSYIGYVVRRSHDIDGDVYMGVNIQAKKTKVLKQDSKEHILIKLSGVDEYEKYEDMYGWNKQKDITEKNIDLFDISEGLRKEFMSSNNSTRSKDSKTKKPIPKRVLTVHKYNVYSEKTTNISLESYLEQLESSENILIMYPRSREKNLTDNKDLLSENIHLAAPSSKKETEYLAESDSVYYHSEYVNAIESIEFMTGKNERKTLRELVSLMGIGYTPIIHVVNSLGYDLLVENPRLHTLAKQNIVDLDLDVDSDSYQYVPIKYSTFIFMRPFFEENKYKIIASPDLKSEVGSHETVYSLSDAYVDLNVYNSDIKKFFHSINMREKVVSEEFVTVIENLS